MREINEVDSANRLGPRGPCGCLWESPSIQRTVSVRFPTAFVRCSCFKHSATWVERYEFDFVVPTNGKPWEHASNTELVEKG